MGALLPQFLQQPISCGLASHRGDEYLEVPVAMEQLHTQTYVYTLHACNRISTYLCFIDLTPIVDSPSTVLKPNMVCFLTALYKIPCFSTCFVTFLCYDEIPDKATRRRKGHFGSQSRMQSVMFQSSKRPISYCMCSQEAEEDEFLRLAVSPISALAV